MPTLTVTHSISYTDAGSGSTYSITATKEVECQNAYRDKHALSASASTAVYDRSVPNLNSGKIKYMEIRNVGAASAYFALNVANNSAVCFEVPAGAIWNTFTERFDGATVISTTETLIELWAKGNTSVEVDIFS